MTGKIWNVYVGRRRYLGIVNESAWTYACHAAMREWPDMPRLRVVLATEDPWRRRTLVRPEFIPPIVTTRLQ